MEDNKTTLQKIWIWEGDGSAHYQGCCFGQIDGPYGDDFINECECEELREDLHDKRVIRD